MKVYTSYFAKQAKVRVPDAAYVSIAVGNPKYRVPYRIIDLKELKPYGIFGKYYGDEYKKRYFERLDWYGVDRIREAIKEASCGHENVFLMCHEKDKNECHRSLFAEWWLEKTGEVIEEYGEEIVEKKDEYAQMSLFESI